MQTTTVVQRRSDAPPPPPCRPLAAMIAALATSTPNAPATTAPPTSATGRLLSNQSSAASRSGHDSPSHVPAPVPVTARCAAPSTARRLPRMLRPRPSTSPPPPRRTRGDAMASRFSSTSARTTSCEDGSAPPHSRTRSRNSLSMASEVTSCSSGSPCSVPKSETNEARSRRSRRCSRALGCASRAAAYAASRRAISGSGCDVS
mmetsp:Transcript_18804/g.48443  ORF Transcript_18804/g.48443 Transcript_18804/m.48443 type:complete len:204 (-) Transcript_18804:518-1129(-)